MEAATTELAPLPPVSGIASLRGLRTLPAAKLLGALALFGICAGTLLVAVAAGQGHSFLAGTLKRDAPGWLTWPFGGLWSHRTNDHLDLQVGLLIVLLAMFACYAVAAWLAERAGPRIIWTAVVVIHVVCFLSPPLLLTDVFNYIGYARMGVLHHLNPYTHIPVAIMGDPVFKLNNWHHLRSPYGPLFTLGTYALAPLGLPGAYWVYKAAVLLASLGCLLLVARLAGRLGRPALTAVVLVGLNPIVLLYGTAGQHNDVFELLLVLGSIHLILFARERGGAAAMVGAAAMKASAAALIPIVALASERRLRALVGALLGVVLFGAASLAAFGPHLPAIGTQSRLVTPYGIPNMVGYVLGRGGENVHVREGAQIMLVLGIVACTVWAWRRRDILAGLGWLTIVTLLTLSWTMPWYVLWLLPFIVFVRERTFRIVAVAIVVWISATWLPLSTEASHAIGFYPTHTATWHQNQIATSKRLK
ncbi:MAG: polyprenol phosphomannose-dependent alpha 1,6 mannosyltransferase MptB [Thermoleophilaceae bacterium]